MERHAKKPVHQSMAIVPVVSFALPRQEANPTSKSPAIMRMIQFIGLKLNAAAKILYFAIMAANPTLKKIWRITKKVFLWLFIGHLVYILFCWVFYPPITITQINSLITGHGLKRDYVSLSNISPNARLAIIASEDQQFAEHEGIDWESMEKAYEYNKTHKRKRGGSTISQQVAKNVFLWQHGGYFRKGLEIYFTFIIEKLYSKRRIMELYLNVSEMGDGIFGIEAAARHYFNKSAKDLTRPEAAMIAACLPNPKVYTIKPMSKQVARRYPWILRQMNNLDDDGNIRQVILEEKKDPVPLEKKDVQKPEKKKQRK